MVAGFGPAVRSMLLGMNLYVGRRTKDADLLALMGKLRPLDCGIDLIRVGAVADGGYLIPDDLQGIEYCFSPGVSTVSEFEDQLANRRIRSYLADYSVDSPLIVRPEFVFDKRYVGASDREAFFTLSTWKNKYLKDYTGDLLLQMDIEGSEYEVILSTPDSLLDQFRIVVIEFHCLDRLFEPFAFGVISSCFEKLLRSFYVVHIHPNNGSPVIKKGSVEVPPAMEFSFINKKRVSRTTPRRRFPHRLDGNNVKGKDIVLPNCWYSPS